MSKAEWSAVAAVAFIAGIFIWILSRLTGKGSIRLSEATLDGQSNLYSGVEQSIAWSQATGIDPEWMIANIGNAEDAAYGLGAPTDWEQRGWPSPLGPQDDPTRYFAGRAAIEAMA
jgi:hypothetical protein